MDYETKESNDDPLITNKNSIDYNMEEKCIGMINTAQTAAGEQRHYSDVMLLHGGDFAYMNANANFEMLESLIDHCNKYQRVNMTFEYSTPMRYYNALKLEKIDWPVMDHDFLPYRLKENESWSGFFTSRQGTKKLVKDYSNLYHAQASIFARRVID